MAAQTAVNREGQWRDGEPNVALQVVPKMCKRNNREQFRSPRQLSAVP